MNGSDKLECLQLVSGLNAPRVGSHQVGVGNRVPVVEHDDLLDEVHPDNFGLNKPGSEGRFKGDDHPFREV